MSTRAQDITTSRATGAKPFFDSFDWLCIFALLLSFFVVSKLPAAPSKYGDLYFHQEAQTLARCFYGVYTLKDVTVVRAPGPVLYYALPYVFLPPNSPEETYWRAAVIWNALWMIVAILLIRRAGALLGGDFAGKIAAILALMVPFAVYYSFGVSAETPSYTATAIFLFGWLRWRVNADRKLLSWPVFVSMAGLFGLLLCRPNVLVLVGVAVVAYAGIFWLERSSANAEAAKRFAMLTACAGIATVLLVSSFLRLLPGKRGVSLQASNLSEAIFLSNFQFRTELFDWRFWGRATRQGSVDYQNFVQVQDRLRAESETSGVPLSKLEVDYTKRDALQHPWIRIRTSLVRFLSLNIWLINSTGPKSFHLGPFRGEAVYFLFHAILNAIALIPAFFAAWFLVVDRQRFFEYWPVWGLWFGLLAFHAATYAEPRYMLPAQPGLAIVAAAAIASKLRTADSFSS